MNTTSAKKIVQALKTLYPKDKDFIALHEPEFTGREWDYVKDCLDTGWVSSVGQYVGAFEEKLKEITAMNYAVAVVNGTAALHIALKVAGVRENDEVLVPSLTFIATANAITYCNAIPHFVDSELETLGVDCHKLDAYLNEIAELRDSGCYNRITGRLIKAIVPMHTFGHPVKMDLLQVICEKYHIQIIEDAAESLGSYYQGKHTGHWGKITTISFNGNKIVTSGGGGAILSNDENLARHARHLTTTAKVPHAWRFIHDQIGYNFRLPNLNAALGLAQLEQLEKKLRFKRALAQAYTHTFEGMAGLRFFVEPKGAQSNYWLNALLLENSRQRDDLLNETNSNGVMTRPCWDPMHSLTMFKNYPRMDLSQTENIFERLVNIPSSACLGEPYVS